MNNSALMSSGECGSTLRGVVYNSLDIELSPRKHFAERFAWHVLHRDIADMIVPADFKNLRDVWMVKRGGGLCCRICAAANIFSE